MAEVDVTVAGRRYRLGCEDGQEQHLAALAASIDAEARAIAAQTGTLQEAKLLLMAALMVADRLAEAKAAQARAERAAAEASAGAVSPGDAAVLGAALDRLESLVDAAERGAV